MRIFSWNVNGLRAAVKKGFFDWLKSEAPDVVCLQEIKAQTQDLDENVLNPKGITRPGILPSERAIAGWLFSLRKNLLQFILESELNVLIAKDEL